MSWFDIFIGSSGSPVRTTGALLAAYFSGCFATGYYLVRWRAGQDIRDLGSGNIGARNAGRVLGSSGCLLTVAGDLLKGALAVWMAILLTGNDRVALPALLAVVAGHMWPVLLRFHGGKGVSTSLAGLLVCDIRLLLAYCMVFALGFVLLRRTVISGLLAYAALPLAAWFLHEDAAHVCGISILAAVILIAHHKNMPEALNGLSRRAVTSKPDSSCKEL